MQLRTLAALVVLVTVSTARADEADRAELLTQIDAKVRAIRDDLDNTTMAPDSHGVDSALAVASELHELLAQLAQVAGDNDHAKEVAANYPAYVDQLRAAATALEALKQDQTTADGVDAECSTDEAALQALIARSKSDDPQRRVAKLTGKGKELGGKWSAAIDKLKGIDAMMKANAAAAHLKLTDSYWLDVSTRVNDGSKGMLAYWTDSYQAAVAACANLALGDQHPDLAPIMTAVATEAHIEQTAIAAMVSDYNIWLDNLRAMRDEALAGREKIRGAICKATGFELEERAKDAADEIARDLQKRAESATDLAASLLARAAEPAMKGVRTAQMIAAGVHANEPLLAKLELADVRGRDSLKLHARLAAIAAAHDAIRARQGCAYKDIQLAPGDCTIASRPGQACHLDCIKIAKRTCDFIEIVPQNDKAKNEGFAHGDVYAQGLHNWYVRDRKALLVKLPAIKRCVNSNASDLDMTNEVVQFDPCAKLTAAELGDPLPAVSADVQDKE